MMMMMMMVQSDVDNHFLSEQSWISDLSIFQGADELSGQPNLKDQEPRWLTQSDNDDDALPLAQQEERWLRLLSSSSVDTGAGKAKSFFRLGDLDTDTSTRSSLIQTPLPSQLFDHSIQKENLEISFPSILPRLPPSILTLAKRHSNDRISHPWSSDTSFDTMIQTSSFCSSNEVEVVHATSDSDGSFNVSATFAEWGTVDLSFISTKTDEMEIPSWQSSIHPSPLQSEVDDLSSFVIREQYTHHPLKQPALLVSEMELFDSLLLLAIGIPSRHFFLSSTQGETQTFTPIAPFTSIHYGPASLKSIMTLAQNSGEMMVYLSSEDLWKDVSSSASQYHQEDGMIKSALSFVLLQLQKLYLSLRDDTTDVDRTLLQLQFHLIKLSFALTGLRDWLLGSEQSSSGPGFMALPCLIPTAKHPYVDIQSLCHFKGDESQEHMLGRILAFLNYATVGRLLEWVKPMLGLTSSSNVQPPADFVDMKAFWSDINEARLPITLQPNLCDSLSHAIHCHALLVDHFSTHPLLTRPSSSHTSHPALFALSKSLIENGSAQNVLNAHHPLSHVQQLIRYSHTNHLEDKAQELALFHRTYWQHQMDELQACATQLATLEQERLDRWAKAHAARQAAAQAELDRRAAAKARERAEVETFLAERSAHVRTMERNRQILETEKALFAQGREDELQEFLERERQEILEMHEAHMAQVDKDILRVEWKRHRLALKSLRSELWHARESEVVGSIAESTVLLEMPLYVPIPRRDDDDYGDFNSHTTDIQEKGVVEKDSESSITSLEESPTTDKIKPLDGSEKSGAAPFMISAQSKSASTVAKSMTTVDALSTPTISAKPVESADQLSWVSVEGAKSLADNKITPDITPILNNKNSFSPEHVKYLPFELHIQDMLCRLIQPQSNLLSEAALFLLQSAGLLAELSNVHAAFLLQDGYLLSNLLESVEPHLIPSKRTRKGKERVDVNWPLHLPPSFAHRIHFTTRIQKSTVTKMHCSKSSSAALDIQYTPVSPLHVLFCPDIVKRLGRINERLFELAWLHRVVNLTSSWTSKCAKDFRSNRMQIRLLTEARCLLTGLLTHAFSGVHGIANTFCSTIQSWFDPLNGNLNQDDQKYTLHGLRQLYKTNLTLMESTLFLGANQASVLARIRDCLQVIQDTTMGSDDESARGSSRYESLQLSYARLVRSLCMGSSRHEAFESLLTFIDGNEFYRTQILVFLSSDKGDDDDAIRGDGRTTS